MSSPVAKPFLTRCSGYESLWKQVDYSTLQVPRQFNLGTACLEGKIPSATAMVAVSKDGSSTTYSFGDVREVSDRLSNALRSMGVGKGDVVAVIQPASFETAVSYMAIFRLGAIVLPLSSLFGPMALSYRLRHSEAVAIIASADKVAAVHETLDDNSDIKVLVVGDATSPGGLSFAGVLSDASPDFEAEVTEADDPAFLVYTSGTTGEPKGALHAHRVAFGHIPAFEALYDFYPRDHDVLWSPADWAWIAGLMNVLVPAWWFGLPVVVDEERSFDPSRALWLLRQFAITITFLPPTALRTLRASGLAGGGFKTRVVCTGAEPVGADLLEWCSSFFACTVNEGYGQTEFNAAIGNCVSVFPSKPGAMGRGLPGTAGGVLNADGARVVGELGEIALDRHHPSVFMGYWRNEQATAEKFSGDWLLTGDLGIEDGDGYLWFVSRKDDVIKSSGYRIGPGEIEACLDSHQDVALSAVVGVPDTRRGHVPKAFVVLRAGVAPSEALAYELRSHVRHRLAAHEVPAEVVFVDDLPRTTTGKLMRRALRSG